MLREKHLLLEPGREHFVDISGIRVSTDSSAAKLDVEYRLGNITKGIKLISS